MEYQFENRNTITQEQMVEYYELIYRQQKKINAMSTILSVALLLYAASQLNFDRMWTSLLALAGVAIFLHGSRRAKQDGKRAYEQLLKYYNMVMPTGFVGFDETIVTQSQDQSRVIAYEKIDKVIALKHSYLILDQKPGAIMLDPNGFTKGTFEEFKQFLRGKRPDLTIPD